MFFRGLDIRMLASAFLIGSAISVSSAVRESEEAKELAADFFKGANVERLANKEAFMLAQTLVDDTSEPVCYVFNAKDGHGFAIISADEDAMPVVGYSDISVWDSSDAPDAAMTMMAQPVRMSVDSRRKVAQMRSGEVEGRLLETPSWSQEAPFNFNIPGRRLAGCVGVALAEILKFHSYPVSRPASLVNAGEATDYAWNSMRPDNYRSGYDNAEAQAVATLVADAAIGIGTDFGMSSSSAFEVKVPYALSSLFGYDAGVSYKKRSELSKEVWDEVIVSEINAGRPVLYSGQDVSSGHAFVCDGYEQRGGVPYFHINWGWGGAANGYYASDALNPVVSKAHSYNDLMTIVYNIKPAIDATVWSTIHVTSDEAQPGLTSNVSDISTAGSFSVRAGALKNISNSDFKGRLAVALFDDAGKQKCLLADARNFSLVALQISRYVDFSCSLPSGISVADGDVVRLVTMVDDASEWLPVAGDLLAPGEAAAKNYSIPYFQISLPAVSGDYVVSADASQVIKGRDFSFSLTSLSPEKVITVRSNGFILAPDANNVYTITNVLEDKKVDVIVQNAADVLTKAILWVTAGNLQNLLSDEQCASVTDLTLFGTINEEDFNFMRDRMKLQRLDISQTSIAPVGSNPANAIPTKAFMGYRSLKQIILPDNITTFKNGCFGQTGLTSIDIPAGVATWEYNVFANCTSLREVTARRSTPAWINWCVFTNTPQTKLNVPVGAASAYSSMDYWKDFKEIVEVNAETPESYNVAVSENNSIKFIALTEGTVFAHGADYVFSAEPDDSFGDITVEVFANTTRLNPDASGNYTAKITANTLIHFEMKHPEPTTPDTSWKLTADAGGIGLASEIVNVLPGKSFTVRANAIKIPAGADGAKFFAMVLTDKDGSIKEFISPIYNSSTVAVGNQAFDFGCQVVDATVKEGNLIRLATSYNKKNWQLVEGETETVCDRLAARGNQVVYHNITMPQTLTDACIEGVVSQVAHGMPLTVKVTPNAPTDRVTLAVNGVNKAVSQSVAEVTVPAVTEDLDITIQVHPAGESDFVVVNVNEGELAAKIAQCPERLKLVGTILVSDFDALRANASVIMDLDLADVTIKGAAMTANSIPENAFAPKTPDGRSALKTIVLPSNLERIDQFAFARCLYISEISIPASVTYVGDGAFAQCTSLKKIIMEGFTPPATGNMSPLPSDISGITLEVPRGAESAYSNANFWSAITPQGAKTIYWIKYDDTKMFVYNDAVYGDGSRIEFDENSTNMIQVNMGLPNCPYLKKSDGWYRPGQIFKLYDNGKEISDFIAPDEYGYGGQYNVKFDPYLLNYPEYATHQNYPQNHTLDLVFYYTINFENLEGAEGVTSEVKVSEGGEVYDAPLEKFIYGATGTKTVFREGEDYKFLLTPPSGVELKVEIENTVMLSPAKGDVEAQMETRRFIAYPDDQGFYTVTSLPGDTKVFVSGKIIVEEGTPIPADQLTAIVKDDVDDFTELSITGEMGEEEFAMLREKFGSIETLDLSQIENEVIPVGAFAGMESLNTVILPSSVTEIGSGAFKGCSGIGSITLPGVNSIGEGAFDGCTGMTSILIPNSDSTPGPSGAPRRIAARSDGGITAEAFRGLSPNCLIYIGANDIPDSEHLNIILNKEDKRVAASDIHLDGNHAFNAPASFMLGDHSISFTADVTASYACDVDGGWSTIILPFQPTEMHYGCEFDGREESGLHLLSFDGEEVSQLTPQSDMQANRPYLANVCAPFASVPVTFCAKARPKGGDETVYDVPFTPVPEQTVAVGRDFSLYGSFDGQARPVDILVLDEKGSRFVGSGSSQGVSVAPFSAYLVPNEGVSASEMEVGIHPLWILNPEATVEGGSVLYRSQTIGFSSPSEGAVVYYTVDGSDPRDDAGSRRLFEAPFSIEADSVEVKAVAEYKGNFSDVVVYGYALRKSSIDYSLAHGWNWISHSMESPVALSDFVSEGIDTILSKTEVASFGQNGEIIGDLMALEPVVGYKLHVSSESWSGNFSGVAFDPTAPVVLRKGWNWIGTPVTEGSLLISDLLSALEVEEGDMLVGLDGFVQADSEGVWQGSVSYMVPGVGYMFFSNSDKSFTYTILPANDAEEATKAPVAGALWTVDNHKYASVMPIVAELNFNDGSRADANEYLVASFCGDECRGIGMAINGAIMINVHGNAGDVISFRIVDLLDEEKVSSSTVVFDEDMVSTFARPFGINIESVDAVGTIGVDSLGIVSEGGSILFSGDLSSVKSVEVFDIAGAMIWKLAKTDAHGMKIDGLDKGVVTVVIRTDTGSFSKKMIVK